MRQRWILTMDIGRERNTWMDPKWAASGRRVQVPLALEFRAGGLLEVCVYRAPM